jgi:hypothetical protein
MRKIETKRDSELRQNWPNYEDNGGTIAPADPGKAFDCVPAKLSDCLRLLD